VTTRFDLQHWTILELSGRDCRDYFNNFCTNDIRKLPLGESCEAFVCDLKGRILGHVLVFGGDRTLWLVTTPGQSDTLVRHLKKYLLDAEVTIQDRSAEMELILLQGEDSVGSLSGFADLPVPGSWQTRTTDAGEIQFAGTTLLSKPGLLVWGTHTAMAPVFAQLNQSTARQGTSEQFEWLRISALFPYVGVDVGSENLAQEAARTDRTISFTKGCYLGQEPIARLDAMGHTNKELRGFQIAGDQALPGSAILVDGTIVGKLTSVAGPNSSGQLLGLGIIRVRHAEPGTRVQIQSDTGTIPATVFFNPQ